MPESVPWRHRGLDGQPSVGAMLEEAAALQQQQELFEMHISQYIPLTRCQVPSQGP